MKQFEKLRVGKPAAPAMNEAGAFVPAEQWVEHLEAEMEPKCSAAEEEDLELVLKNSPEDFAIRDSLKRVRAAVKSLDDVALPESGHYYDDLHSKIMAAIDEAVSDTTAGEPARKTAKSRVSFFKRGLFAQPVSGAAGMTMMIAILAFVGLHKRTSSQVTASEPAGIEENFERKIAMVDSHAGAQFARDMGSFESEEDFLTESAARRLKHLSSAQAEALMRSLRR